MKDIDKTITNLALINAIGNVLTVISIISLIVFLILSIISGFNGWRKDFLIYSIIGMVVFKLLAWSCHNAIRGLEKR